MGTLCSSYHPLIYQIVLDTSSDVSHIFPISFTRSGQILGAPKDFFETYMLDVMDIAMEAMGQ